MLRRMQNLGPVAVLWAASSCLAAGGEPANPWRVAQTIMVDPEAWRWNWASWDQDKIATCGDFQYTVFWDADRVFVLARRDLRDDRVQTLRLPQFKLSSDDAHRNTCLGISSQDGRLHLSWDHHNDPLRYTRSRAGFLTNPPAQLSPEDLEPPQPIAQGTEDTSRVTYPRFLNDAAGRLFLFYRQGGSGNGEDFLFRYEAPRGTWTRVGNFVCLESRAEDQWNRWRSYPLAGAEIGGLDASKHDRRRWDANRVLSFTFKAGPQGLAIVDLRRDHEPRSQPGE